MPLAEAQRESLQAYAEKKDRGREPVFVGRKDLFELVAGNARAAARGDVEGRTICIAGPPGIGKTAFLTEFAKRTKAGAWGDPPAACVSMSASILYSPGLMLAAVASQLPEGWRRGHDEARGLLGRMTGADVGFGFGGFALSASATWDARKAEPDPTMPWAKLAEVPKPGGAPEGAVVILMVDEAHSLKDTPGEEGNLLLRSLHEGPRFEGGAPLPAFAVFAGHTHTPDWLEKSISGRFAEGNQQYMRTLSEADALDYVGRTLSHFGVSGGDPGRRELADWIARECGGFPRHLRSAMGAVAESLLSADSLALSDLDGAFVAERLSSRREAYYEVRAKGAARHVKRELGALLRKWDEGDRPRDKAAGQAALRRFIQELDPEKRELMAEDGVGNSAQLIDEMIRNGLLMTDRSGGGCRCPIDSMAAWLESGGDAHALRAPFPTLARTGPRSA